MLMLIPIKMLTIAVRNRDGYIGTRLAQARVDLHLHLVSFGVQLFALDYNFI